MGDEQVGQAHLVLEFVKHVDDLGLDGNVQGRNRLVTDHKLRVHGHGPGDADALPLAAGELMGVAVGVLGVKTHLGHQVQNFLRPLLFIGVHVVNIQRLSDDVRHGHPGVQGRIGVLKHHSRLFAVLQQILFGFDLFAVKENLAGGGFIQVQQGPPHGGFAAAGFTHQAQGLPPVDGEGHVVHGL